MKTRMQHIAPILASGAMPLLIGAGIYAARFNSAFFPVGMLAAIAVWRLSGRWISEFEEARGRASSDMVLASKGYLEYYAHKAGVSPRFVVALVWLLWCGPLGFVAFLFLFALVSVH